MSVQSLKALLPWSFSGQTPFFNTYGDRLLFGAIAKTRPIECNPDADCGVHSAVPHKYVYAYLLAIKSLLRYDGDLAVYAHDDGTLLDVDRAMLSKHIPGIRVIDRSVADGQFEAKVADPFLAKVRSSYTSYLKLFDPTLVSDKPRIIIVDTDVLFLQRPSQILEWAKSGGVPWYHQSESWLNKEKVVALDIEDSAGQLPSRPMHIQQKILTNLDQINRDLNSSFKFVPGFNSGFIGYENGVVSYDQLKVLLTHLYDLYGEAIFRWGSEQTMHGLVLCGKGAVALPRDKYMVYTSLNSDNAINAAFVHFIGEFRYYRFMYPRLASAVIKMLRSADRG